jgi:hypothetical protein
MGHQWRAISHDSLSLKLDSPGGLPARGDFVEYTEEPYAMDLKR